jgi:molybdopterin-containing oxidoreductase family membrane subunit
VAILALLGVIGAALAYTAQLSQGLTVTGLNNQSQWGIYLANYVFWIGISKGGTLISALLRLTRSGWRRPVTRCAEAITVFAMVIGPAFAVLHMGRPMYFWRCFPLPDAQGLWPNFRSPLVWDVVALTTYLVGSLVYLWMPLIPDAATLRDRTTGVRKRLYTLIAVGWEGTARQWALLEAAIRIMAVVVLCVAVSVHTVVSFVFGLSTVPGWHSTIFGPMFVMGAMYSGLAAVIVAMAVVRSALGLQERITARQFDPLAKILLVLTLVWAWFIGSDMLTVWYGGTGIERAVLATKTAGAHGATFWAMVLCNLAIPLALLPWHRVRRSPAALAGICVVILAGMYLERMHIVIPALETPRLMAAAAPAYSPGFVELAVSGGTVAAFVLMYMLFVRYFPIVAIWEWQAGERSSKLPIMDSAGPPSGQARLTRVALAGGAIGFVLAIGVPWFATAAWPINVGGMDPSPVWTGAIVAFEGAMLGVIVATVLGLIRGAPLLRPRSDP